MVLPALRHALTDQSHPSLRPLPDDVARLLQQLEAPPRLAAHLRCVHDVACTITNTLISRYRSLAVDQAAVCFGAATHDIGKVVHPQELAGPGSAHEPAGRALLLEYGVPQRLARFAATHGTWSPPDRTIEDLLVSLADKIWKGRRQTDLETLIVTTLAAATGIEPWEAFLRLDEILEPVAADAEARLGFQAGYPVAA